MGNGFFQETEASTSEGQNTNQGFYTPPAQEHSRTNQETHNHTNGESPNSSEGIFAMYEDEHIGEGIKQCKNSIIGKILAPKQISKQVLHSSLMGIWCSPAGFKITELENNMYQFSFEKENEITRILKGEPWIIRNVWLKLHLWNRSTNIQELDFKHVPLWIQFWGLPLHCKTTAMGFQLGTQVGKVEESAVYEYPDNAKIIKIKVQFDISTPIRAGMYIGHEEDGINWVDFRFENLPLFCFKCGLIGHAEDNCEVYSEEIPEGSINPRGPWLRSKVYGKRINDKRDQRFHSNPLKSVSGSNFSPIPKAMTEMMANLQIRKNQKTEGTKEATANASKLQEMKVQHSQQENPLKRKILTATLHIQDFQQTPKDTQLASLDDKASQGI